MVDYESFLSKLHENLNILREREAKYGGNAPLELLNQVADHREAIALTGQARRGDLSEAEWRLALRPLLVALEARGGEAASGVTAGDIGGGNQRSAPAGRDAGQVTINVLNLMGEWAAHQDREMDPAAQSILELVLAQVKAIDPRTAQRYPQNPAGYQAPLQDALAELLAADRGLVARLDTLLAQYEPPERTGYQATVTGSGAVAQGPGAMAGGKGSVVGSSAGGHIITGSGNRVIDTGGGTYVEGGVDSGGGSFTGRDRVNHTDDEEQQDR